MPVVYLLKMSSLYYMDDEKAIRKEKNVKFNSFGQTSL